MEWLHVRGSQKALTKKNSIKSLQDHTEPLIIIIIIIIIIRTRGTDETHRTHGKRREVLGND